MQARVRFGPRSGATLCGDRACRGREMQARVHFGPVRRNPLRRSCVSRARNAGESAFWPGPAQPSAEIVRVESAICRRECILARSRATLCGDRARQGHEMQARVRFGFGAGNALRRSCVSRARNAGESAFWPPVRRNPLRRSCVSRARYAGESAFWLGRGQPSAEIVRVEGAKCRRECVLARSGATLCGDRACRERDMQARVHFGPVAGNPLRRSCASRARNAGESLDLARATLCGDRACRGREMQARVRFGPVRRNPLRRSCVSRARNAGESAFWPGRGQPCAAKCRRECVFGPVATGKSFSELDSVGSL